MTIPKTVLKQPQMLVYRFMSLVHALDAIQNDRLRIGRILELNDPYDCAPGISGADHIPPEKQEEFEAEYFSFFNEGFGMLSYSATFSDPVIWSHYANKHFGMAFGFDYHEPADGLIEVNYSSDRKIFPLKELERIQNEHISEAIRKVITGGFTVKALGWKYEKEYRQFINLDECTPQADQYFRPFPRERLKSIIVGARSLISISDILRSIKFSNQRFEGKRPHFPAEVRIFKAYKHWTQYEMCKDEKMSAILADL